MGRQAEALKLAEDLLREIEMGDGDTTQHVLKATRLARLTDDDEAAEWLGFEMNGGFDTPAGRAWMTRTRRWTEEEDNKGHWGGVAGIQAQADATEMALTVPPTASLSGDHVAIANRENLAQVARYRHSLATLRTILGAIDAQVHLFVSRTYHELRFSELQASLFEASREAIDATLVSLTGDALKKIDSIGERLSEGDSEAVSQAMNTCRRLIDAVADSVFPARPEPYVIGEQPLAVDQSKTLNRLNAYIHTHGVTGGRADRLRRTLQGIYGRTSVSVHTDVQPHEARYLFLSTYVVLGEILTLASPTGADE